MSDDFTTIGQKISEIPVRISYRIIELFSEGLYASPHKAVEELVSNSYDAGAKNVHIIISPDRKSKDAVILVIDDGLSMDEEGLRQHWLIGVSNKRQLDTLPLGRKQIGKFGIGKLATLYLLTGLLTSVEI
ncbi:MAG: ATP-binding protein [Chloroflexota bacterium]